MDFHIEDGVLEKYYGDEEHLVIPSGVTRIAAYAFLWNKRITCVVIPEGVTSIGNSAFKNCTGLTEVRFPESVTCIGDSAFEGCIGLKEVNIPKFLMTIGNDAFRGCSNLQQVHLCEGVTNIGNYAFQGCKNLIRVSIPRSIETLGDWVFSDCNMLKYTTLFGDISQIGHDAIHVNVKTAKEERPILIVKGDMGETLNEYLLRKKAKENVFMFDAQFEEIAPKMLYKSKATEKMKMNAVQLMIQLQQDGIEIRQDVYESYIAGLNSMKNKILKSNNYIVIKPTIKYMIRGEMLTIHDIDSLIEKATENNDTESLSILINYQHQHFTEEDYEMLATQELQRMEQEIEVMEKLEQIKRHPESKEYIDKMWTMARKSSYVKESKDPRKEISFPVMIKNRKVTGIADDFEFVCESREVLQSIHEVTIPKEYVYIGTNEFKWCKSIKKVNSFDLVSWMSIEMRGTNPLQNGASLYLSGVPVCDLVIPNGVTSIGRQAFSGCKGLQSVTIPSSVETIEEEAFRGCKDLKKVIMAPGLKEIKDSAFSNCPKLEAIVFPEGLISIGRNAFMYCKELSRVTVPSSLKTIGSDAFRGCNKLKKVICESLEIWMTIDKSKWEDTPLSAGGDLYLNGTPLHNLTIPSNVASIGAKAFAHYSGLITLKIPSDVCVIGIKAFSNCRKLRVIDIQGCKTAIAANAFEDSAACALVVRERNLIDYNGIRFFEKIGCMLYTQLRMQETNKRLKLKERCRPLEEYNEKWYVDGSKQPLSGLTFVATGNLSFFREPEEHETREYRHVTYRDTLDTGDIIDTYVEIKKHPKREDLKAFIESRGGRLASSISSKTSYLILGKFSLSNKEEEAEKRGIQIIKEKDLIKMIESESK